MKRRIKPGIGIGLIAGACMLLPRAAAAFSSDDDTDDDEYVIDCPYLAPYSREKLMQDELLHVAGREGALRSAFSMTSSSWGDAGWSDPVDACTPYARTLLALEHLDFVVHFGRGRLYRTDGSRIFIRKEMARWYDWATQVYTDNDLRAGEPSHEDSATRLASTHYNWDPFSNFFGESPDYVRIHRPGFEANPTRLMITILHEARHMQGSVYKHAKIDGMEKDSWTNTSSEAYHVNVRVGHLMAAEPQLSCSARRFAEDGANYALQHRFVASPVPLVVDEVCQDPVCRQILGDC